MIKISIIGAGNVGINLFKTLRKKKEVKIVSLFNKLSEGPFEQDAIVIGFNVRPMGNARSLSCF